MSSSSPFSTSFQNKPTAIYDDIKYRCIVCLGLLVEPNQTECGHHGCKECFQNLVAEAGEKSVMCPVGEPDCGNINKVSSISSLVLCNVV